MSGEIRVDRSARWLELQRDQDARPSISNPLPKITVTIRWDLVQVEAHMTGSEFFFIRHRHTKHAAGWSNTREIEGFSGFEPWPSDEKGAPLIPTYVWVNSLSVLKLDYPKLSDDWIAKLALQLGDLESRALSMVKGV